MSTAYGRPQGGRGVRPMWTGGRQKPDLFCGRHKWMAPNDNEVDGASTVAIQYTVAILHTDYIYDSISYFLVFLSCSFRTHFSEMLKFLTWCSSRNIHLLHVVC